MVETISFKEILLLTIKTIKFLKILLGTVPVSSINPSIGKLYAMSTTTPVPRQQFTRIANPIKR